MSDKAVGHDWKKSSIYTLRHGAGPKEKVMSKTNKKSKNSKKIKKTTNVIINHK